MYFRSFLRRHLEVIISTIYAVKQEGLQVLGRSCIFFGTVLGLDWLPGDLLSTHPIRALSEPGLPFPAGHFLNYMQKPPYFVQVFWEYARSAEFWPIGAF